MYFVRFIQNWNNSQLTTIDSFTDVMTFHIPAPGYYHITSSSVNFLEKGLTGGMSITVSNTVNNNGVFTILNASETLLEVEETVIYEAGVNTQITPTAYDPEIILRDTSVFTDKLKLVKADFDAEKYMADDFFLREPREAKIVLFKDNDGWLNNNFLYHNDNEINHVLYTNKDGVVLEYEGIDPELSIGQYLGGTEEIYKIDGKEVLIQQFSKIIIEIWERNSDGENIKRFVGLIDKSKTVATHTRVTLNCIDFTGLIKIFGEQLIKVLITADNEDYYQYIIAPNIITELLDKIKNFTKLEIDVDNNISNYSEGITTNNNNNLDINDYLNDIYDPNINNDMNNGQVSYCISENIQFCDLISYDDVNIITSDYEKAFLIYESYRYNVSYSFYTSTFYYEFFTIRYHKWTQDGGWTIYYKTYTVYGEITGVDFLGNPTFDTFGDPSDEHIETVLDAWLNSKLKAQAFIDDEGLINYIELKPNGNYDIVQIDQERYSVGIPIYADTYTYMELLKTILFLNVLTIFQDQFGMVRVMNKKLIEQESNIAKVISERDIINGYNISAIEKDELEMSNALELIWYDLYEDNPDNDGILYDNLDNKMKQEYAELFLTRFPLEFNGKIKKNSAIVGIINNINIGDKLNFFNREWIIVSSKLNVTGFEYAVKAYGLSRTIYTGFTGVASASSVDGSHIASNAFDGSVNTMWISNTGEPHWLKFNFSSENKKIINKYILICTASPSPISWKFQGSNNDATWIDLDEQIDYEWIYGQQSFVKYINNTNSYQYYRLYVTDSAGGVYDNTTVTELELRNWR